MKKLLSIIAATTILTGCMEATSLESIGKKDTVISRYGITYVEIVGECEKEKHESLLIVKCKGNGVLGDHTARRGTLHRLPPRDNKSTRYGVISTYDGELKYLKVTLKAR